MGPEEREPVCATCERMNERPERVRCAVKRKPMQVCKPKTKIKVLKPTHTGRDLFPPEVCNLHRFTDK